MNKPLHITIAGVVGTALVFGAAAVCVRLGVWQLHRLGERERHNALMEARMAAEPVPLERVGVDTALYRRVTLRGVYDNEHTIILANRSRRGLPGVDLVSPLRMAGGDVVLVERGWLPSADAETVDITPYVRADTVVVEGIVLPFPERHMGAVVGEPENAPADAFARTWFQLNRAELDRRFPYAIGPFFVREMTEEARPPGSVPHLDAIPAPELGRGPHLSYAIQWFSFALIFLVGWGAVLWRASRNASEGGGAAGPREAARR
ncbi:MAG TPA: SURF1 family protein [Longimicrobiales bacterium]|nr:SURF1 family protein [Longimicrobiales bacterium]